MSLQNFPRINRLKALSQSYRFYNNPIPVMMETVKEQGNTFESYLGGLERTLYTIDPKLIQYILQKNRRNFHKSKLQTKILSRFAGKGLLTVEGDYWLRQRRLIQPGFHKEKLAGLVDIMLEAIEIQLNILEQELETKGQVDIADSMMDMAFQIVAKSLFSTDTNANKLNKLCHNVTAIQKFVVKQVRKPFQIPWYHISGQFKAADQLAIETKNILNDFIQNRKHQKGEYNDLLDMLLSSRYEDTGKPMSDQQLIDEALIFFSAGHETSANALAWTWYTLSQNPTVVQKIKDETSTVLEDRKPSFADIPKLSYTMQVVKEVLRLYPPAWIMDRIIIEDDEFDNFHLPKNTMIFPFVYGAHRNPEIWERPNDFLPERFSKERMKNIPPYAYLPFGGGPRMCIGVNFAYMEMQLIVIQLLRRMELELIPNQKVEMNPLITLRPKYGIKMKRK